MSNRQARREQMRTTRNTRLQSQKKYGSGPGGPRRGSTGGLPEWATQPFTLLVVGLVIALVAIFAVIRIRDSGSSPAGVTELEKARQDLPLDLANGNKLGKDDAPLKITMFEDFQCPFCLQFTSDYEPNIVEKFVKTGKVQIIYNHLPLLGAESVAAAKGSTCAAQQNKFWEYHNQLFLVEAKANQRKAEKTNVGRFSEDKLKQYASDLGLDRDKFDACFADPATLAAVQEQNRQAQTFGLRSTPSFLFNDQSIGSGSLTSNASWEAAINGAIDQLTKTPTATATASASPAGSTPAAATTPTATRTP